MNIEQTALIPPQRSCRPIAGEPHYYQLVTLPGPTLTFLVSLHGFADSHFPRLIHAQPGVPGTRMASICAGKLHRLYHVPMYYGGPLLI